MTERLNVATHGDPGRPAILCLHGFMSSNAQWMENVEALSASHFVLTAELWGHGDSPLPADPERISVDGYVGEFERIRQEHDIVSWALIGQSYGAGVMIRYALAVPASIDAVVVTNSRSAFGTLTSEERNREDRPEFPPADLRKLPYHPIHARRFPDRVKAALVESADRMSPEAVRSGGRLGGRLNCTDVLDDLEMPLLLTNGVYERSFQADLARLRERYPDMNVADLEGGHSVNIEAAAGFDAAVLAFLGDLR